MPTTRAGNVSLAYYVDGHGPTVLCIMGIGERALDWNPAFVGRLASTFEVARFVARNIPGARLVGLEGCGHMPMWECPERLASELAAFFRAPMLTRHGPVASI